MIISVYIERICGMARITARQEYDFATNKPLVCPTRPLERPINDEMLVGTPIPKRFWYRLGAFVTMLFSDPKIPRVVIQQTDDGRWIVDAFMKTTRQRNRRGEGETPVEAFANLVADIYG